MIHYLVISMLCIYVALLVADIVWVTFEAMMKKTSNVKR